MLGLSLGLTRRRPVAGGAAPAGTATNLWTGGLTTDGATASVKLSAPAAAVRMAVSTSQALTSLTYGSPVATTTANVAKPSISGLSANTQYYYAIEADGVLLSGTPGKFKTLPSSANPSFSFALGSCQAYDGTSATLDAIAARTPLFFLAMGDTPYMDLDGAISTDDEAEGYLDTYLSGAAATLYRNVPIHYMWSDHDFHANGATGASVGTTLRDLHLAWYRRRVPHVALASSTPTDHLGHSFVVGKVRFVVLDCRSYASLIAATDDSSKTRIGAAQKTWFKAQIDAAFTAGEFVFVSCELGWPTDATVTDSWGSYATERLELVDYMKAAGMQGRVAMLQGDMHASAINKNIDYATGTGMAIPVLCASPLDKDIITLQGTWDIGPITSSTRQYGWVDVEDPADGKLNIRWRLYTETGTVLADWSFQADLGATTAVAPYLQTTSLNSSAITSGAAAGTTVGDVVGQTHGSTLSLADTAGSRFAMNVATVQAGATPTDYATATTHNITIRETLAGAVNTPRDTPLSITVNEAPPPAATPPSVRAAGAQASTTGGAVTVPLPAGLTEGDYMLILLETAASFNVAQPTGWTVIGRVFRSSSCELAVFGKLAGASESSPVTGAGNDHCVARMLAIQGVNQSTPVDVIALGTGGPPGAAETPFSCVGVTTTVDNALVINCLAWGSDNAGPFVADQANASLSSLAKVFDGGTTTNNGGGIVAFSGVKDVAGAVSATTGNWTVAAGNWSDVTVAFRPA